MLRTFEKRAQKIEHKLSPHYADGPYVPKKRESAKSYNDKVNQDNQFNVYKFMSRFKLLDVTKIPFIGYTHRSVHFFPHSF